MGALTETEKQKLSEWSATEVMGWVTDRYTLNLSYHNVAEGGIASGQNEVIATVNWRPWESLDQAVMVAERIGDWVMLRMQSSIPPYYVNVHLCVDDRHWTGYSGNPAEALLICCADAVGENWRDE